MLLILLLLTLSAHAHDTCVCHSLSATRNLENQFRWYLEIFYSFELKQIARPGSTAIAHQYLPIVSDHFLICDCKCLALRVSTLVPFYCSCCCFPISQSASLVYPLSLVPTLEILVSSPLWTITLMCPSLLSFHSMV